MGAHALGVEGVDDVEAVVALDPKRHHPGAMLTRFRTDHMHAIELA